jgi:hypothetical protein
LVSTQGISISVDWAIAQYRQALATVGLGRGGKTGPVKAPKEPPEVISYLQAIGIGRHIDTYA